MKKNAFGDSITVGGGASPSTESWIGLFTPKNNAVNNTGAGDMAKSVITNAFAFDPSVAYMFMIGTNDHRTYKADATKQEFWKKFLRMCVSWVSLENKKLPRVSGDMTFTGTWANTPVDSVGKYTTQLGATAEAVVNGDTVYISHIIQNSTATQAQADVYIDGNLVGTLDCFGAMNTSAGGTYAPAAARFSGLGAGSHTVRVVVTTSGKNFHLYYIGGSDNAGGLYPEVLLSNVIRMSAAAYTTYGSSDANVDQFNAIINDLMLEFASDGFNVTLIDNHASIDPTTDLADGVHPNNAGHAKIHENFNAAL